MFVCLHVSLFVCMYVISRVGTFVPYLWLSCHKLSLSLSLHVCKFVCISDDMHVCMNACVCACMHICE